MKLLKKITSIILVLLTCFTPVINAASNTFVISSSNLKFLYGSNYLGHGSTLNFTYKTTNDGKIVYCTEIHDAMTSSQETYTYSYKANDAIAYVLENGYPSKSITGNKYKDYYITGLAIWYLIAPNDSTFTYFNLNAGTYKGYDSDVVKEINKLVTSAKKYKTTTPKLWLTVPGDGFTLKSDGKNYDSRTITINKTANVGDYNVELIGAPSGSKVVKNGNFFLVRVPASSMTKSLSFTAKVTATGTVKEALVYNPAVSSHQSLVGLFDKTTSLSQEVTFKFTKESTPTTTPTTTPTKTPTPTPEQPKKGTVSISKLDASTGKELAGATLVVKDSNETVIDKWVSDGKVHVIKNLDLGTYKLTETYAPDGYVLNEETVTFTITENKLETSAVMYNKLKEKTVPTPTPEQPKKGTVSISKLDIANDKELAGATLVVKDSNETVIDKWVSDGKVHVIKNLDLGTYTLTEIYAPEGYVLNEETVTFTITESKLETSAVMYNSLKEVTKVKISKQDITNGKELSGAHLVIKDSDGNIVDEWISGNEPHYIEGKLEAGKTYTLTETIAPEGYVLNEETIKFTVNADGSASTVIMYNAPSEVIVNVPKTSSFKNTAYSLMGILGIGLGSLVIFKKTKENK